VTVQRIIVFGQTDVTAAKEVADAFGLDGQVSRRKRVARRVRMARKRRRGWA
jgi:hypothetical protein